MEKKTELNAVMVRAFNVTPWFYRITVNAVNNGDIALARATGEHKPIEEVARIVAKYWAGSGLPFDGHGENPRAFLPPVTVDGVEIAWLPLVWETDDSGQRWSAMKPHLSGVYWVANDTLEVEDE